MYEIVYTIQSRWVTISTQQAFGNRIRSLRTLAGLTQEDLAERCGLFRTYLSRIETGVANPTLTMIYALAATLGVPVTDLFVTTESTPKVQPAKRPSRGRVIR